MENKIENIKNGEHKLIWQKIEHLEKYLIRVNGRQWKLTFALVVIFGSLCISLIVALLKMLP